MKNDLCKSVRIPDDFIRAANGNLFGSRIKTRVQLCAEFLPSEIGTFGMNRQAIFALENARIAIRVDEKITVAIRGGRTVSFQRGSTLS